MSEQPKAAWDRRSFLKRAAGYSAAAGFTAAGLESFRMAAASASPTFSGNVTLNADYTVPAGVTVTFDPNVSTTVSTNYNFIVNGTLQMRPANAGVVHTLTFTNVDESKFVGGGMVPLATDVGLWVVNDGILDAYGTRRVSWNRTGDDPTWLSTDTVISLPFNAGDSTTYTVVGKGATPLSYVAANGMTFTQEITNSTRNVIIQGTAPTSDGKNHRAHIFICSTQPQTVKYVRTNYLGPRKLNSDPTIVSDPVLGRYGFHFHHSAPNSLVEGVFQNLTGSHCFVSHGTDGTTWRDCVAYKSIEDAYWWDSNTDADLSNNVTYDHCLAAGIKAQSTGNPGMNVLTGFKFVGFTETVTNCAAVGIQGGVSSSGFEWPESFQFPDGEGTATNSGNISHNNKTNGVYAWETKSAVVNGMTCYRNGKTGIWAGAYKNDYQYNSPVCVDNTMVDIEILAASGAPPGHLNFQSAWFGTTRFANHQVPPLSTAQLFDCHLGHATVKENDNGVVIGSPQCNQGYYDLIRCDLEPANWTVSYMHPLSLYRVQRADNTAYRVNADGTTTVIPQFYP